MSSAVCDYGIVQFARYRFVLPFLGFFTALISLVAAPCMR